MPLVPPRSYAEEMMDHPHHAVADMRIVLGELRTINRYLGGRRALVEALEPLLSGWTAARAFEILDVGTGGGDLPVAVVRLARRRGVSVRVTAVDRDPATAALAAQHVRDWPEIRIVCADAFRLPFPDRAFDVSTASLFLHHFDEDRIALLLARLVAASREAVVVNDLRRHVVPWQFIRLATRLAQCHPMIRHDAPLSVLRGFTPAELETSARRAGAVSCRVDRRWPYRIVLTLPGSAARAGAAAAQALPGADLA